MPCWKDWSPRGSVIFDVFGNGKTAVKVSTGPLRRGEHAGDRRREQPAGRLEPEHQSRLDAIGDGNFFPDCDLSNPLANGECQQFSNKNFGRPIVTTRYADDMLLENRAASWAGSVVFQHEVRSGMALNMGYYRTTWANFRATDNLNVESTDYSSLLRHAAGRPAPARRRRQPGVRAVQHQSEQVRQQQQHSGALGVDLRRAAGDLRRLRPDAERAVRPRRLRPGRPEHRPHA